MRLWSALLVDCMFPKPDDVGLSCEYTLLGSTQCSVFDDFDDVSFVEERVFDKVDVLTDEDILDDKFDSENTTELEFSRIFL